ncbi:hypothetical protein HYQ46_008948 [Verticillium longisporum]|nr:hypothetical protein HYQ46_008948 [Verticillium longisporum]
MHPRRISHFSQFATLSIIACLISRARRRWLHLEHSTGEARHDLRQQPASPPNIDASSAPHLTLREFIRFRLYSGKSEVWANVNVC